MPAGARLIAALGQKIAHAAVGMNVAGIDAQGGFEVSTGLFLLADQEQQIGKIDVPHGIVRMVPHGLAEQRARGAPDIRL